MDRLFRFAAILVIAFSSFASSCGGGPTAPSPIPVVNPPTAPRLDLSPLSPKAREIFIVNNLGLETGFVKKWTGVITIGGTAEIQPYLPGALKFWEDKKIAGISFQLGTSGAVNVTVQEFQGEACAAVLSRNVVFDTGVITGADVRFRPECFFRIRDGPNGRYFIELILAHEIGHVLGMFGHVTGLQCLMGDTSAAGDLAPATEEFYRYLYSTAVLAGAKLQ